MNANKNRIAFVIVLVLTIVITIGAISAQEPNLTIPSSQISDQLQGNAIVKAPLRNGQLLVSVNEMDILLNISEETLVIDSMTGLSRSLEDLKVNDSIFVHYVKIAVYSMPPQAHAIAIVTQEEENKNHAEFFIVKEIISREDGEVRAINKEGNLIATFFQENPLMSYKTEQVMTLDDIEVGTKLFIWFEEVQTSYPGQTRVIKTVLVGQE